VSTLIDVLYAASNALLVPVAITLLALGLVSLALLGGVVREWPQRRRWARARAALAASLRTAGPRAVAGHAALAFFPRRDLLGAPAAAHDALLSAVDEECRRGLALTSFGSRVGPALGLMGTLIPLGPALTALAAGDVETLSQRLVVAFTTTVVGLLVGILCFAVGLVRARWFADDLLWLELLLPGTREEEDAGRAS